MIEYKAAGATPRQQELFRREVATLQLVHHPNVVELRRVVPNVSWHSRSLLLLELELCSAGELFDFVLHGGPFPEPAARHATRELFGALAACHAAGVYHRDLKPENILVSVDGNTGRFTLKVADFGLAVFEGGGADGAGLCRTAVGTRAYQAPEVLSGGSSGCYSGAVADSWSAAVVVFILLAGNPPFTQATVSDWWFNAVHLGRHRDFWAAHQRPPCPTIGAGAQRFLNRAFVEDPARRATVAELCADPWLAGLAGGQHHAQDAAACQAFMGGAAAKAMAQRQAAMQQKKCLEVSQKQLGDVEVVFSAAVNRSVGSSGEGGGRPVPKRSPPVLGVFPDTDGAGTCVKPAGWLAAPALPPPADGGDSAFGEALSRLQLGEAGGAPAEGEAPWAVEEEEGHGEELRGSVRDDAEEDVF